MSNKGVVYSLAVIVSFPLGILFAVMDGMLLWSIAFFALGIILVLMRVMWNIAVFADKVTRKLGED